MYHITPNNDIIEHEESTTCHCAPGMEEHDGNIFCVHKSYDGREYIEKAITHPSEAESSKYLNEFFMHLDELTYVDNVITEAERTDILGKLMGELIYELREYVPKKKPDSDESLPGESASSAS